MSVAPVAENKRAASVPQIVEVQARHASRCARLGPDRPEVGAAQRRTFGADEDEARNNSSYSAKGPAVIVRLDGMSSVGNTLTHWQLLDTDAFGATAIQWDAEPTESVHGQSIRRLPQIDFGELVFHRPNYTSIVFELLAEGYRRIVTLSTEIVFSDHADKPHLPASLWL